MNGLHLSFEWDQRLFILVVLQFGLKMADISALTQTLNTISTEHITSDGTQLEIKFPASMDCDNMLPSPFDLPEALLSFSSPKNQSSSHIPSKKAHRSNSAPEATARTPAPIAPVAAATSSHIKRPYVHPKPFKMIANYQMIKTLGQGSMGKVKLGRHNQTGEYVAIKVIPRYPSEIMQKVAARHHQRKNGGPPVSPPPVDIEYDAQRDLRILREAFTLKLLNHAQVVHLLDFVVTEHYYYLIFEHVPGRQLLDYVVQRGRMKEDRARNVMRQILDAVDYCHKHSLVHRDLKIENIMMEEIDSRQQQRSSQRSKSQTSNPEDIRVKILDFGLANFCRPDRLLSTFCGSLYFAAPELLQARPYIGPEVDMWSIGVIAFVLVCGSVPFDDANLAVLHSKIKSGKVNYPSYLSPACLHFLKRLLHVNPKHRGTMEEMLQHPWVQGESEITGYQYPTRSNGFVEPLPFMNNSLGNRLKLLSFSRSGGTQKGIENETYGKHVPISKLAGQHPNPYIVELLKRNPFHAADFQHPFSQDAISYTREDGTPLSQDGVGDSFSNSSQPVKLLSLASPFNFGFGLGFGFSPEEVDNALRDAMVNPDVSNPVVTLYHLLWQWIQRAWRTQPNLLPERLRRQLAQQDERERQNAQQATSFADPNKSILEGIPEPSSGNRAATDESVIQAPRVVSLNALINTGRQCASVVVHRTPFTVMTVLMKIMHQEGLLIDAFNEMSSSANTPQEITPNRRPSGTPTSPQLIGPPPASYMPTHPGFGDARMDAAASMSLSRQSRHFAVNHTRETMTPVASGGSEDVAFVQFLQRNQKKNGHAWTVRSRYRPSFLYNDASRSYAVSERDLKTLARMTIRFEVEIVHVYLENERDMQDLRPVLLVDFPRVDSSVVNKTLSGIWFRRVSGDDQLFQRIVERVMFRCKEVLG